MALVPVRIGVPEDASDGLPVFVVELANAVQSELYSTLRKAERSYQERLRKWSDDLARARANKGNPIPRLELGADIDAFFDSLKSIYNMVVTNQEQALTSQLGISRADLDYIRRASRQFSLDDVRRYRLNWSQVISMTGIRTQEKLRDCLELIAQGRLTSQDQLRAFRREANTNSR